VKVTSLNGSYLDLRPHGYQLDFVANEDDDDDDDDWLVIGAKVRTDDHREWDFTDPCLVVAEAWELATWLDQVAMGQVAAAPRSEVQLCFIEPNLAFSVAAVSAERVELRVHFSYESVPPWHPRDQSSFIVILDVGKADVQAAAAQWRAELAPFPNRY
jgi:hypothetical protein